MRQPLDFNRMIAEGAVLWREEARALDSAERLVADAAANDPVLLASYAVTASAFVRVKQEKLRGCLREWFGIVVDDSPENGPRIQVIDEQQARPTNGLEVAHGLDLLTSLLTYNAAQWSMTYATRQAAAEYWAREIHTRWWVKKFRVVLPTLPANYPASAALSAFFYVMRNAPILYASSNGSRVGKGPPLSQRLEEAAVGDLAAWVRSRIKMYESLRAALGKVGDPQEVLLQELPGVVLTELAELNAAYSDSDKFAEVHHKVSERGVHRYLTNRVSDHLRALGGEATTSRKRAEEPAQAEADYALDDFVLQETVRQQLDALEEAAAFSAQQTEVWRQLRKGAAIGEIAADLRIPKKQVSVVAHKARKKAREAREATGL